MHMPNQLETYIHRVGRTARAGRSGTSVTLLGEQRRKLLKSVVTQAKKMVKSRTVPADVIEKHKEIIGGLKRKIRAVFNQERLEKEARIAEMEANKATNIMLHEKEIMSRPRRTWFQNDDEKQAAKLAGAEQFMSEDSKRRLREKQRNGDGSSDTADQRAVRLQKKQKEKKEKKDPLRGLKRREKRKKMMRMEWEQEQKERRQRIQDGDTAGFTSQQKQERAVRKLKAQRRGRTGRGGDGDDDDGQPVNLKRQSDNLEADIAAAMAADRQLQERLAADAPQHLSKRRKKAHLRYNAVGMDHDADAFSTRYAESDRKKSGQGADEPRKKKRSNIPGAKSRNQFKSKSRFKRRK
eukprot:TRINITY_DN66877_c17_g1_i1.p1 TRINITY_DN66877_c17_g1~~TRINITY_DN66877_c17_g1_i1.p1  ORF type:complete len:379 (-),score=235.01 TRINITY_DN66877_c17_g1_i1:89-1144(-)